MPFAPSPTFIDELNLRLKTQNRKTQEMFAEYLQLRQRINSIVGSGSGPVLCKVQTDGVHGLSDGDKVIIAGALISGGGSALHEANGYWTVTVTATNEFTLNGSTYTNSYGGSGSVYDGVSYAVNFPTAPSGSGALLIANIKKLAGQFIGTKQAIKQITVNSDVEWMRADASFEQALFTLLITNNSGASISGSLKMRTTKALGNIDQAFAPFTLASNHSITLTGESMRWQFDASGLPKVS